MARAEASLAASAGPSLPCARPWWTKPHHRHPRAPRRRPAPRLRGPRHPRARGVCAVTPGMPWKAIYASVPFLLPCRAAAIFFMPHSLPFLIPCSAADSLICLSLSSRVEHIHLCFSSFNPTPFFVSLVLILWRSLFLCFFPLHPVRDSSAPILIIYEHIHLRTERV